MPWFLIQCSATCGEGLQKRNVTCVDSRDVITSNESCANKKKPETARLCTSHCGRWKQSRWSKVSGCLFPIIFSKRQKVLIRWYRLISEKYRVFLFFNYVQLCILYIFTYRSARRCVEKDFKPETLAVPMLMTNYSAISCAVPTQNRKWFENVSSIVEFGVILDGQRLGLVTNVG